ncbi:MAG TPA: hypothetical protein VHE30_26025 [Polyangiaceae bacterium]|nr:hypothetical protein [Polyangiaceae bacterium]
MAQDEEQKEPTAREAPGGFIATTLLAVFLVWLLVFTFGVMDLKRASDLGSAFQALGTLVTVGALLAGLETIRLQREDLRLQREELKLQRQEMKDSRAELARTAQAQEDLAKAQRDATAVQRELVTAQEHANVRALAAEHAQRVATIAALESASMQALAELQDTSRHAATLARQAKIDAHNLHGAMKARLAIEETLAARLGRRLSDIDRDYIPTDWREEDHDAS